MSNALTNKNPASLALHIEKDPFEAFADAMAPQTYCGKLLKFSKSEYVAGEENERIKLGTTVTAGIDQMSTGWIKWQDNKPVEQILLLVASNQLPPPRSELGDIDQTKWELNARGERRDPWQATSYLPMVGQDGKIFTFAASSKGAHTALGKLARAYARHRRVAPDDLPMIRLDAGSYQHQDREYGRIHVPELTIMGWEKRDHFIKTMKDAGYDVGEAAPAAQAKLTPSQVPDDEVPF